MTLLDGIISRRTSLMKNQGARKVYTTTNNLQSSLDLVGKSIQQPAVIHGSQKQPNRRKVFSGGKQKKHTPALEAIAQESDATEDSRFFNCTDINTGPDIPRPLPLKLAGSVWWNIDGSSKHPSTNLTFVTSALDMSTAGDSENCHVSSHASNASTSMDKAPQLNTSATTGASDSLGTDTALHSLAHHSRGRVSGVEVISPLDKFPMSKSVDKPLPAKPTHRNADSPERRGIIDALESGAQALDENHPVLKPAFLLASDNKSVRAEQNKLLDNSRNLTTYKEHGVLQAEKLHHEENIRRVRNNQSIENFDILSVNTTDTACKQTSEVKPEKVLPKSINSPSQAPRNPQFSRIPQANVSLYGSPIARKAFESASSSVHGSRSSSRFTRVASRVNNDELGASISPRIKYGRSAPRIDPEADLLILGDDVNAKVTNSFQSMRSLRASKETENLILKQCQTSYQGSPSMIPRANLPNEKFPPRVSSLQGSPEAEKVDKQFAKSTSSSQPTADRLSRPTASSNIRTADSRHSIAEQGIIQKVRAASGTVSTHSTRKSFSGRLSSMLPRRRAKTSSDVEKPAQAENSTSRKSRDEGRGGYIVDKSTFGFRKHKAASGSDNRDEQVNTSFLTSGDSMHQSKAVDVKATNDMKGRDDDHDEDPSKRAIQGPGLGQLVIEEGANLDEAKSADIAGATQQNPRNRVEQQSEAFSREATLQSTSLQRPTVSPAGVIPRSGVHGSGAIAISRGSRTEHSNASGRIQGPRDNARPRNARPSMNSAAAGQTDVARTNMAHHAISGRQAIAGASGTRAESRRYSTVRHINIAGSSVANRTSPLSALDSVDPAIRNQYLETRTTRMLNTLMVDARLSLDRARVIAGNVHDPSIRDDLLDLVQDERDLLDCLHHARRAHLAAGVRMFDLFRNATNNVDELVDRSIDAVVNEEAN